MTTELSKQSKKFLSRKDRKHLKKQWQKERQKVLVCNNYLTPAEIKHRPEFNTHHRWARCQGGDNSFSNRRRVDLQSHICYNNHVSMTAHYFEIPALKNVHTYHIAFTLQVFYKIIEAYFVDNDRKLLNSHTVKTSYPVFKEVYGDLRSNYPEKSINWIILMVKRLRTEGYKLAARLFVDPVTKKLKPLKQILEEYNFIWFPEKDQFKYEELIVSTKSIITVTTPHE